MLLVLLEPQDNQDQLEIEASLASQVRLDFLGLQDHREILERQDPLACLEEPDFQDHWERWVCLVLLDLKDPLGQPVPRGQSDFLDQLDHKGLLDLLDNPGQQDLPEVKEQLVHLELLDHQDH